MYKLFWIVTDQITSCYLSNNNKDFNSWFQTNKIYFSIHTQVNKYFPKIICSKSDIKNGFKYETKWLNNDYKWIAYFTGKFLSYKKKFYFNLKENIK